MGPGRSKGEAKETSTLTSSTSGPSRSEDSRPSSRESPQEKQPVILKFGKQDNGQYYKKDVSSSSSGSSSSKKDKDRDKYRSSSSKDKRSHHREDRAPEADSSGRVTPTSNSNSNSHKPLEKGDKSSVRKQESSSSSETAVKVEAMEVDSDAALSAIKTTSCSVSLDKSKVDMKLLAGNSGVNGALTSTPPPTTTTTAVATTAKSEVQITPITVASTTKVEADTSCSAKKDANSSVIETIKKRGSDVYAMMPDDEDVKPEPLGLLTSKVNSDTDSGVTMTSVQATLTPSPGSGTPNSKPLESETPPKAMDTSTSSGAVSSSAGQSGSSNGGGVTIEQVAVNKKDDTR